MGLLTSSGTTASPTSSVQTTIGPTGKTSAENVIGKGNALINTPTPDYTGKLTAGPSTYQTEAWQGLSNLTLPDSLTEAGQNLQDISALQKGKTYTGPTSYNQYSATGAYNPLTAQFSSEAAQQYMNPYLQQSLNPQLEEARRQAMISQQGNASKATSQGAFGGSRAALMEAENQRGLMANMANITGQGYNTAYQNAMNQFNADQTRNEASRQFAQSQALANAQNAANYGQQAQQANLQNAQFGATYGLQALQNAATSQQAAANAGAQEAQYGLANLNALAAAGNTQQAQDQAALNALYNQYLDQRNQKWTTLANQANLVKSLGGSNADTYSAEQSDLQKATGVASGAAKLMENLKSAGLSSDSIKAALKSIGYNPETLGTYSNINTPDDNSMTGGGQYEGNTPAYDSSGTYIGYYDKDGTFHEID